MYQNQAIIEKKADILKALSNPIRLCIVRGLLEIKSCTVSHIQSCINSSHSTLSQHVGN